jgi:hypothetical protein
MVANGLLIAFGAFMVVFGMQAAFAKKHPRDTFGAFLALAGLVALLLGILRLCVPGFFSE